MTLPTKALCPEKFTVFWLTSKLADAQALDIKAEYLLCEAYQQQPDTVLDLKLGNTSTVALIKLWLQEGDLPCYSRGKLIDYPPPVPEIIDLDTLLSSSPRRSTQSYDSEIWIRRDELAVKMASVGLPLPEWMGVAPSQEDLTTLDFEGGPPSKRAPTEKKRANAANWDGRIATLVDALIRSGFDPQDLPAAKPGKPGPRETVRPILEAAGLTKDVIMETWTRAYSSDRIKGGGLTSINQYQQR